MSAPTPNSTTHASAFLLSAEEEAALNPQQAAEYKMVVAALEKALLERGLAFPLKKNEEVSSSYRMGDGAFGTGGGGEPECNACYERCMPCNSHYKVE